MCARELRARLRQRFSGLNRKQAPERVVDRGKKDLQEASVGSESLSGSLVRLAQRLHCKVKKTLFNGLLGARRRIESELENGRGQRAEA